MQSSSKFSRPPKLSRSYPATREKKTNHTQHSRMTVGRSVKPPTPEISTPLTPAPEHQPSLWSVMATRQLAKRYVKQFRLRREEKFATSKQPTYQLIPKATFQTHIVLPVLKAAVDTRMKTVRYSSTTAAVMTKLLTVECKEAVMRLNLERYKVIVTVTIGDKHTQGLSMSSRCVWDTSVDNMVEYTCKNAHMFCTVVAYGVYTP